MTLILLLVFGSVVVLVAGIALVPRRPVERKRLARLSDGSRVVVSAPTSDESILADTRLSGGARLLTFVAGSQTETKRGRRHPLRQRLVEAGYAVTRVEGFDLFPQTPHVEALAILDR